MANLIHYLNLGIDKIIQMKIHLQSFWKEIIIFSKFKPLPPYVDNNSTLMPSLVGHCSVMGSNAGSSRGWRSWDHYCTYRYKRWVKEGRRKCDKIREDEEEVSSGGSRQGKVIKTLHVIYIFRHNIFILVWHVCKCHSSIPYGCSRN